MKNDHLEKKVDQILSTQNIECFAVRGSYLCMPVSIYVCMCVCMCLHVCAYACVCIYTCVCVCMNVCM